MGTFDWNNDGKTDLTDDFLFLEVICKDDEAATDEEGPFPTPGSHAHCPRSAARRSSSPPPRQSTPAFQIGRLTMLAIVVTIILCLSALFMGYGNIIGDLLGLGFLGCIFTSWLENNHANSCDNTE